MKKDQARAILFHLQPHKKPSLPCKVTLTRIAPRSLDFDNLGYALKHSLDTIADWLLPGKKPGQADGDSRFTFCLNQKKGEPKEYALEIKIEEL